MSDICGIYKITCTANNKVYIGSSINIRKRKNTHLCELRNQYHRNKHLQNCYNKHGESNLIFETILECIPKELLIKEEEQIKIHDSYNTGFNLVEIPTQHMLGFKHTEESKSKMSRSAKDRGRISGSLTNTEVNNIRQKFFNGERVGVLAQQYNIHRKTIRQCVYLTSYQDIPCNITGYTEMLENLKLQREQGKRPRSSGWKHSLEFIKKIKVVNSRPLQADKRKLTPDQIREIRHRAREGETCKVLANEFGVNQNSISRINRRLTYRDVKERQSSPN